MKKLLKVFITSIIMPTAIILSGAFLLTMSKGLPFLTANKKSPQNINSDVNKKSVFEIFSRQRSSYLLN